MSHGTRPLRGEVLAALAAVLDSELEDFYAEHREAGTEATMAQAMERIFGQEDAEEQIREQVVVRAISALGIQSEEEIDEREDAVQTVIQVWLDGFALGLRYRDERHHFIIPKETTSD